jgi:hypothetical protein
VGNPFIGCRVLANYANIVEKAAFLSQASEVLNFDVRPVGEVDVQMDMQDMTLIRSGSYDAFLAVHVLNHVANDRKALSEIHRALKPGGIAVLTVPYREGSSTSSCENVTETYGSEALAKYGVGSYRRYGLQDVLELFGERFTVQAEVGFDPVTQERMNVFILRKNANVQGTRSVPIPQLEVPTLESKDLPRGTNDPAATTTASSLQPCPVFRSDTRWGRSVIEWPSLDAFLATTEVHSGVHSVPIGEFAGKQISYDFLLTVRLGTVLLCHFHGNTPREEGIDLPLFTGLNVTSSILTSMFVPSDPALALDASLGLAWHFGCDGIPLQAITVSIIKRLQTILHVPRVVTWGGSAGGFAAIRVAKDIPNSIAFVWNPQTDIAKYEPGHVMRYLRSAFPTIAADGTLPSGREQITSFCTKEFREGYKGCVLYLQERTDWHVDAHLKPFLTSFCGEAHSNVTDSSNFTGFVTDQLYLHLDHWGDGHIEPRGAIVAKVLSILSNVVLACRTSEVIQKAALNLPQHATATKSCEIIGSDPLGSVSHNDLPPELKDILTTRMDRIVDDFHPFDVTVICSGDTVALPLFTEEIMEVSLSHGVQWERTFAQQPLASLMWLFSLAPIGRLLSTFQQRQDNDALQLAVITLNSFLDYSREPDHQSWIGRFPSADHSAALRVKVLIKYIQVMRERPDVDHALLKRVFDCLTYWSDWLADPVNYKKNNHGLMGSIALLHSAVQFGAASCASAYRDVATRRIIELGTSSFDRDGLCNENTIGYHNFNVHCYRGLLEFCKHYGGSDTLVIFLEELILRATKALEFCVWQDGSIPPIGDSAVYRIAITSRNEPRCFYESGFAVVKNDDLYVSILCGAPSEIHKQVDDSSMTLRFMNREILVDGGSYLYERTNPHRRCVESSLGHSGLFLKEFDGLLRSEFLQKYGPVSGKIERFEESDDGVRVKCVYSVSNGRVVFVRHIFVCWPDEIAIVDSVELREEVAFRPETVQRFLFGPTLDVQFDERNKLILAADEFESTLFQLLDCDGVLYRGEDANPVRGWCSYKYMEILPTYGVDFVSHSQRSRFSTIIKLAKCTGLSECSTSVRAFADGADPFVSQCVRHSAS